MIFKNFKPGRAGEYVEINCYSLDVMLASPVLKRFKKKQLIRQKLIYYASLNYAMLIYFNQKL